MKTFPADFSVCMALSLKFCKVHYSPVAERNKGQFDLAKKDSETFQSDTLGFLSLYKPAKNLFPEQL